MTESALQSYAIAYLRLTLPPRAIVFHPANGGHRDKRTASILKGQGVLAGVPDIIILLDAKCYGIELKAGKGKLNPAQFAVSQLFDENGIAWTCARSIDDIASFLAAHGVTTRVTLA